MDYGLLAVIFVAPWFMGGRHPLGRLVYVAIVCATALAWGMRQCLVERGRWRISGAELLLAAGLLLIVFQLVPLPHKLLVYVSPSLGRLLPQWSSDGVLAAKFGTWSQVSLIPDATRIGLSMYLSHAMLFLLVVQRVRDVKDVERWMRWIVLAVLAMAVVALVQRFAGNGRFLWIYQHPYRSPDYAGAARGAFFNPNHYAHFLALGIGPLIWWVSRAWSKQKEGSRRQASFGRITMRQEWDQFRQPMAILALVLVAFAALLSLSRGGICAMAVAAIGCTAVYWLGSLVGRKFALAALVSGSVVLAAVFLFGREQLAYELDTVTEAQSIDDLLAARKLLWEADMQAARDFAVVGTGVGSHREVYPTYFSEPHNVTFRYAESSYVQLLVETGIAGLVLITLAIGLCGWWCVQTHRQSRSPQVIACLGAVVGGLSASVLHSFVDFVWHIPACMSLAVILAACACRLCQLAKTENEYARDRRNTTRREEQRLPSARRLQPGQFALPRTVWIAASVMILGVGILSIKTLIGPAQTSSESDRYRTIARKKGVFETNPELIDVCQEHLEHVLERYPCDAEAHLRMASLCLQKFHLEQQSNDNNMPLTQIRDAALASRFSSREALDQWLSVAIGDHYEYLAKALVRSRHAVRLCPLLGEGYVYLAELAFLEGSGDDVNRAYVEQAMKVRPFSAGVNFAAGQEAALSGNVTDAMTHFKVAYEQEPYLQSRIVELFGQQGPEFFLEHFEPDLRGMSLLRSHYTQLRRDEDARKVTVRYVAMLRQEIRGKDGENAARQWLSLQVLYDELGEHDRAVYAARQAVAAAPNDYKSRRNLATRLFKEQQFAEAAKHLQWCLLQCPEAQELRQQLELAKRSASTATRDQRGTHCR